MKQAADLQANTNITSCTVFCEYKAGLYLETRLNQTQILILASVVS